MVAAACAAAWSACSVGAPVGFSQGTAWTLPLVGPLEDGLLLTTGTVHGRGPYLFAIDPDANVTQLDHQIVEEAHLRGGVGPHRIDETDTGQVRSYAEMLDLQIGNLKIDRRDAMVFPNGFYDTEGRHINRILGRDAIADSLVFGFDRDQGIATLSTVRAFRPPPGAVAVKYETISAVSSIVVGQDAPRTVVATGDGRGRAPAYDEDYDNVPARLDPTDHVSVRLPDVLPVPRRLANAEIGGAKFAMHLDLGAVTSQLRTASWDKAKLASTSVKLRVVDEAVTAREVTTAAVASHVSLVGATSTARFVPYVEKRFMPEDVDGALGLDFFQPYVVYADWDSNTYLLTPRGDATATTTARFGRWGGALLACPHPSCVAVELAAVEGGTTLHAVRDDQLAHRDLEVLIGVAPADAPPRRFLLELPAEAASVTAMLPAGFAGATVATLDADPFPRACPNQSSCVYPLQPQADGGLGVALGTPVAPPSIALDKLHRLTGEPAIAPDAEAQKAIADQKLGAAIVKLCLSTDGAVSATRLVKSSGVTVYDEQLQAVIRASWTFTPIERDGKPAPVCALATFLVR